MFRMPFLKMNVYLFMFNYLAYSSISAILFISTSQGWSQMFWLLFVLVYYFPLPLFFFFLTIIISVLTWNFRVKVQVNLNFLIIIIILQIIGLLTNTGDCGDSKCSYLPVFFVDKILQHTWYHTGAYFRDTSLFPLIIFIGVIARLLYFISFFIFIFKTLNSIHFQKKYSNSRSS